MGGGVSISREQVADLQPGDVVRLVRTNGEHRYTYEGPVKDDGGDALAFDDWWLRDRRGNAPEWCESLTVVSRAPRLYVNHDRSEPVPGDVVRDEMTGDVYVREHNTVLRPDPFWWCPVQGRSRRDDCINLPLTLLVDADTGQVVP